MYVWDSGSRGRLGFNAPDHTYSRWWTSDRHFPPRPSQGTTLYAWVGSWELWKIAQTPSDLSSTYRRKDGSWMANTCRSWLHRTSGWRFWKWQLEQEKLDGRLKDPWGGQGEIKEKKECYIECQSIQAREKEVVSAPQIEYALINIRVHSCSFPPFPSYPRNHSAHSTSPSRAAASTSKRRTRAVRRQRVRTSFPLRSVKQYVRN